MTYSTEIPDVAVWTHRWSDYLPCCVESLVEHTRGNYNIIIVCEPGTCHENMQRVIERSHSRFIVFVDEDVQFIHDGWLDAMVGAAEQHDDVAIVGCMEGNSDKLRRPVVPKSERYMEAFFVGAYCMLVDRKKLPNVYADTNIPYTKCMTDVDICFQAIVEGLRIVVDRSTIVFHNQRKFLSSEQMAALKLPDHHVVQSHFPEQVRYMQEKWADSWDLLLEKKRKLLARKLHNLPIKCLDKSLAV